MDFSWILLALFLVAVIRGASKALSKSMLKNSLRLGAVVVAFLISFALQLSGVFQNAIATVVDIINLAAMLPGLGGATALISAIAGTIASPIIFVVVFFPILWILRIVIHFVCKGVEAAAARKAEAKANAPVEEAPTEEAPAEEAPVEEPSVEEAPVEETSADEAPVEAEPGVESEACEDNNPEISVEADDAEEVSTEEAPAEDATAEAAPAEAAPVVETPVKETVAEPVKAEKPSKAKPEKKKKKSGLYEECAWKRIVSIATSVISSILVFAIVLMPLFYVMSLAISATGSLDESDADDSQVYQILDVVDEYIVDPYENSFVYQFYNTIAITDLLNFTTKSGGKILLDNGTVVYADDVLKTLISHGVSAATQVTSAKSECANIKADVEAIISNPMVSSLLADVLMNFLADYETEEPAEGDLMAGLIANFTEYYKNADKAPIESDLQAIGSAVGVLAEERILAMLISGGVDIEALLSDGETLGNVVEAISGLSAFGPTVEGAFGLGIEILGDTLHIPADDSEAYEIFMNDLAEQMVKESTINFADPAVKKTIQNYVYQVAKQGKNVAATNGISGHKTFIAYAAHWEKVQSAFAHASEDQSYGYFTMQIGSDWYIYDKNDKVIVIYDQSNPEIYEKYKDKISPIAGIINALAMSSSTSQLTIDKIYERLNSYVASTNDEVSKEVASRILDKDGFVTKAVTIEALLAATDFTNWTDEEKARDSRLCVEIIMDLLGLMDSLGNVGSAEGVEAALDFVDQFGALGQTMDVMKQTSCINQLPRLLIEGIVKSDMLSAYMKPSIAFQINNIVENNDKSYQDCMNQIATNIKWAINAFGGAQ